MANKTFLGDSADIYIPLESFDEGASEDEELPPPYEYPKIDFSNGWKDRGFIIVFWVLTVGVIIVGIVLGMPIIYFRTKLVEASERLVEHYQRSFDLYMDVAVYAFVGAAAASSVTSLVTFFLLLLCAGRTIMCTFIMCIVIEVLLGVVLLVTVHWGACLAPFCLLLTTLIFIFCVRKRIPFAEVHLRVGCAVLRSHPSLILMASGIFIVEFLVFVLWLLMTVGILFVLILPDQFDTRKDSPTHTQSTDSPIVHSIIEFAVLLSWYWGAAIFTNILRFISACTVGHWWFGNNTEQQYTLRTSVKRAFSTNFGTICLGSYLAAVLDAVRFPAEEGNRANILTSIAACILRILRKLFDSAHEWTFVYAALTGQSFGQANRSFTELNETYGWILTMNDILIKYCLWIIHLMVVLTSTVIGGLIAYIFVEDLSIEEVIITIIIAVLISSLIGWLFSAIMTTTLHSCVRTVSVCFALNPAALGATHPEHLQHLTKVWHKFYPTEFVTSGYAGHLSIPNTAVNV
jgi:hypothetical protein